MFPFPFVRGGNNEIEKKIWRVYARRNKRNNQQLEGKLGS